MKILYLLKGVLLRCIFSDEQLLINAALIFSPYPHNEFYLKRNVLINQGRILY
jgi:hypothetical protein